MDILVNAWVKDEAGMEHKEEYLITEPQLLLMAKKMAGENFTGEIEFLSSNIEAVFDTRA